MTKVKIKFSSFKSVNEFVNIVSMFDFDADLISGRYAVDAKSIMGLYSLDLNNPIQLVAHTDDADKVTEALKDFIVD